MAYGQLLEIRGTDAVAFAQAQFINDLGAVAIGGWQFSGWLTAKGRLVAFFAVARLADDALVLWLPDGGAEALADGLRRYVFRSKLTLRVLDDWHAQGSFGPTPDAPETGLILTLPQADGTPRHLRLTPQNHADDHSEEGPALHSRWRLADLRLGLPYIAADASNSEQFVPQWLSLERLQAFSLKKGCYPGQEIVARMHYLGQSKRSAHRLRGLGAAPPAMARVVDADGASLGEIVWAQADGEHWEALAVLADDKSARVDRIENGPAAQRVGPTT